MVHSIAEFNNSTMMIRNSDAIITAVQTALIGRMMASGVRTMTNIRSSRNEGSCRRAAEKPSRAKRTESIKVRKFLRFRGVGLAGRSTICRTYADSQAGESPKFRHGARADCRQRLDVLRGTGVLPMPRAAPTIRRCAQAARQAQGACRTSSASPSLKRPADDRGRPCPMGPHAGRTVGGRNRCGSANHRTDRHRTWALSSG